MFKNEALPIEPRTDYSKDVCAYKFDRPSPLLLTWGRLFQIIISQAGTWMLTGKFHNRQTGIYKAEGGINLPGIGELVLGQNVIYWDGMSEYGVTTEKKREMLGKLQLLIMQVVLCWDPNDPIEVMLEQAALAAGCTKEELAKAVASTHITPFNGNPLSDFFGWNSPEVQKYRVWCEEQHFDERRAERADHGTTPPA